MNTRIATAAATVAFALLGSSSAAFAQQSASGLSRATVQAEVAQARAAGELGQIYGYSFTAPALASTQSRSQVKAEVIQARNAGALNVADAESYLPPSRAQAGASTRSRAEVKAEVLSAIRRGERLDVSDRS